MVHLAYPRATGGVIPQAATIDTFRRFHAVTRGGDNKGPQTLVPGFEERRAVSGPQAQQRQAWHALPWLAPLAPLSKLEAHVEQGWFDDGRRTKRPARG